MTGITAQVSLYPLGQAALSPAIKDALHILRKHDLEVEVGTMSSLVAGEQTTVFAALQSAFNQVAKQGPVVMAVTYSNAFPMPVKPELSVNFKAIGFVENEFDDQVAPELIRSTESRIIINPDLVEGLRGLEPGQQLMVLFHLNRSREFNLLQHPRGDKSLSKRGVFTLRSPHRPNPIGVTVVDLLSIQENVLHVRGLDAINRTPVLDLKPA
jgi:tRNA-Thr(GGU) m(6)t(6)A37 methyltransferase TsaA